MKKVACALIRNFGLHVLLRQDPTLLIEPVVLAEDHRETAILLEVNGKARRSGVRVGMTVAQANALFSDLVILLRNEKREKSESRKLTECLQNIAPFVADDVPGRYYLGADGLRRLYGDEAELANRIISAVSAKQYPIRVGIAVNKFAARVAAQISFRHHFTNVSEGSEREFLADLSISHLDLDKEMETRLRQLGLRTMGQLAAFPTNELQERFGQEGLRVSQLSRGRDPDHFLPEILSTEINATSYFTTPLYRSTDVGNQVGTMLKQLFTHLVTEARACRSVAVKLVFSDTSEKWFVLAVARPTVVVQTFLRQFHGQMEKTSFPGAVEEISTTITDTAPLVAKQLQLDGTPGQSNGLSEVDEALAGILSQQPCRLFLNYSPLPEENYQLLSFFSERGVKSIKQAEATPQQRFFSQREISGLRLMIPVQEAEVTCCNGLPTQIRLGKRSHRIRKAAGPWKLSGKWWSQNFNRQYFEIDTTSQQQYLLYFDTINSRWYLQGVFD